MHRCEGDRDRKTAVINNYFTKEHGKLVEQPHAEFFKEAVRRFEAKQMKDFNEGSTSHCK